MEQISRSVVLRYYLMVNYLASYKSISLKIIDEQRHENKMMDYKQECFDDFYELTQFNEHYEPEFPQHINIFHDAVLDVRQFDNTHWKKSHYIMNTIFGVMFYLWKVLVFLLENTMAFLIFGGREMIFEGDGLAIGWFIWMGFVLVRDVLDCMIFYRYIKCSVTFKTYYFDNKILAAILKWKDKHYHKQYGREEIVFEELNKYYWDYVTQDSM